MNGYTPINAEQRAILRKLLEKRIPGRDDLLRQLSGLEAINIDSQGSLRFRVMADSVAPIKRGVVAEARYADSDTKDKSSPHVNLLLHVVDGKLSILEVYKDDSTKILKPPDANNLWVFSRYEQPPRH
jgi:hypothetical protein